MSDPFIAEIRIFEGNFAPRSWAFCNGQLLPIAQNTALFALIGTVYGGDGRTTTALPNLQSRAPMHPGNGPGLTSRRLGERSGVVTVTLTEAQMPQHTHQLMAKNEPGDFPSPASDRTLARSTGGAAYGPDQNRVTMAPESLPGTTGGQAHSNMQPLLAINFIIALQGTFPSRP